MMTNNCTYQSITVTSHPSQLCLLEEDIAVHHQEFQRSLDQHNPNKINMSLSGQQVSTGTFCFTLVHFVCFWIYTGSKILLQMYNSGTSLFTYISLSGPQVLIVTGLLLEPQWMLWSHTLNFMLPYFIAGSIALLLVCCENKFIEIKAIKSKICDLHL